jgi:putative DNA primase/helicase
MRGGVMSTVAELFGGKANADPFELPTELAAATYFVEHYGQDLRYCERLGGWLVWDGRRWKRDVDGEVFRRAGACARKIADSANQLDDLEARKKRIAYAIALQRRRGLEAIAGIAQHQEAVAIGDPARFDADPWLLNVANGTIDLRTGELRPHRREDLLTRIADITFDPQARAPRWEQFLQEVFRGDADTIAFVQRAIGYSLTGSTREHALFILHGTGRNGKSTFLAMVGKLLGAYAAAANAATFMGRRDGTVNNDLARLHGARFVSAIETNEGQTLAEAFVKALTGGDRLVARHLFQEFFEFMPSFKIWLSTNHKPGIRGGDEAIWRRIRLIPFEERFDSDRADLQLGEKLENELPGILAWAVTGCLAWQRDQLGTAVSVAAATEAYRSEMDTFGEFLNARCTLDPAASAPAGELFNAYRAWCNETGEKPLSQRWFGMKLGERGLKSVRTKRQRLWIGLRIGDASSDAVTHTHPVSYTSTRERDMGNFRENGCTSVTHASPEGFCDEESWPVQP